MAVGTLSPRSACLRLVITLAAAGNGDSDVTMTRNLEVADISVLCTATDSGGNATLTLARQALGAGGFNALSSAMACTTVNALARTTVITVAQQTLANTDVLRATIASAGGGTANGKVYLDIQALAS